MEARKAFNENFKERKSPFNKEKPIEKSSITHSNRYYYVKLEIGSNLTEHSSFPWEIYFDDMHHLEETKLKKGKSFLMFPNGLLMAAFDETFGENYNYHMDDVPGFLENVLRSFTFRREFSEPARYALLNIASLYRRNNPKKFRKKKDITFIGIHQRRGDHIALRDEHNIDELAPSYFLESMEMFRQKFKRVVFVYVSDDLEWGREKLERRIKSKDFFIAGSLQDPNLKGNNADNYIFYLNKVDGKFEFMPGVNCLTRQRILGSVCPAK